jgi:hypothetical protein
LALILGKLPKMKDPKTILTESVIMNIDIFKIHYDMNALEIIKNIQVENSSTGINTMIST